MLPHFHGVKFKTKLSTGSIDTQFHLPQYTLFNISILKSMVFSYRTTSMSDGGGTIIIGEEEEEELTVYAGWQTVIQPVSKINLLRQLKILLKRTNWMTNWDKRIFSTVGKVSASISGFINLAWISHSESRSLFQQTLYACTDLKRKLQQLLNDIVFLIKTWVIKNRKHSHTAATTTFNPRTVRPHCSFLMELQRCHSQKHGRITAGENTVVCVERI